ncbi:MAG: hypothetical protein ROO76_19570 [Terriglobia bacterium]|jgi:hypothetical protein|nr:hypothetical protein [Terriglobia bacterium]
MLRNLFRFAISFAVVASFVIPVLAQNRQATVAHSVVDKLLAAPEHQDIPWKVNFFPPRLMYQQMYLVQIRARVDLNAMKKIDVVRALHFVARAQGEDGKWLQGGEYKDYPVPANLGSETEIEYAVAVYFRPGNYTLTLAVFDADSEKSSIAREMIRIPKLNDDPIPELNQYLPAAEFAKGFPDREVGNDRADDGELFPVMLEGKPVPVANTRPVLVDIVLNITKRPKPQIPQYLDRYGRPVREWHRPTVPSIPSYDMEVGRVLQTGNLLARLGLESGCVRVSAVDALRMKTMIDRADEKTLDWVRFEKQIKSFDQDTVDVGVLTNKKGPAQFMRRYLDQLSSDSGACGASATHYIVIVTHEVAFPAKDQKLPAVDRERARFYYLYSQLGSMGDDLADLLKPVKPERLSFNTPRDLRKAFAKILFDLKSGK